LDILYDIWQWKSLGRKIIYLDEVNFTKLSIGKQEWSSKLTNISVDQN
jgi:hypothetical protein